MKEKDEEKYTTQAIFKNLDKQSFSSKTKEGSESIEIPSEINSSKITIININTTNKASLYTKARSNFAKTMEKQNITNPLAAKQFLMVSNSPDVKVVTKKHTSLHKSKHSQSLPQLRGLLDKVKNENSG